MAERDLGVGIGFFVTGYTVDALTLARAIERLGFDSLWVPEHTVLPTRPETAYPAGDGVIPSVYGEMADPFVLLSFVAAVTERIRLGTGVCLVPEHHPLTLAKTVSTLDAFSNGRLSLGIGVGWLPEETELYGVEFRRRWAYTEEAVAAMRALWEHGAAAYQGQHVRFPEVRCDPRPVQAPGPPVILGVPATERGLDRVARLGDGWLPVMPAPAELERARRELDKRCRELGRDPAALEISVYVMDVTADTRRDYASAGADRIVVGLYNHPATPLAFERWGEVRQAALAAPPPPAERTLQVLERLAEQAGL